MTTPSKKRTMAASFIKLLDQTASVQRVNDDATIETDATVIEASIKCTLPTPVSDTEKEREKMGNYTSLYRVFSEASSLIDNDDRFIIGSVNLRIRKINYWPLINPKYLELFCEAEQ